MDRHTISSIYLSQLHTQVSIMYRILFTGLVIKKSRPGRRLKRSEVGVLYLGTPRQASTTVPSASSFSSAQNGAASCMPTGRPSTC